MLNYNKRGLREIVCATMLLWVVGCWPSSSNDVVVYTALDSQFSEPVFEAFSAETGVDVRSKFDTESTKTVGLANAIGAEAARPRCDVFWNNEILNTLRLEKAGLLEAYNPPNAKIFPAAFRSPKGLWHGFAARARVLIVNTELVPEGRRPDSILDLADPKWRGRAAMAKPLFGTTATHAACLFSVWGDQRAKEFFKRVKANQTKILAGNKQVALSVAAGRVAWGMTDTDDAIIELEAGRPVAIVYPDQSQDGSGDGDALGTLFIPNTVAIIRGGPAAEQARRLVDFLLSPRVEKMLAAGPSAQIPLNTEVESTTRVKTPKQIKPMLVDFEQAAQKWDTAARFLRDEFATGR
ncbi:MAG: extracellular solute-binding protein [Planctomycetota bacterium]|nr:extracellular solute-binding protein [Planctomycetota bacterium]